MSKSLQENIISTLAYFDVFNYPLTIKELRFYLHHESVDSRVLLQSLRNNPIIFERYGYYFLHGKHGNAVVRKMREGIARQKRILALRSARFLKHVPGIRFIGISGSVALEGARENDDIDLFIICKKNTLWITRFFVTALVQAMGKRRRYRSNNFQDKFCLNMYIEEDSMSFYPKRNIYIAHEIAQMKVLFDTNGTYAQFLSANVWIEEYFPSLMIRPGFNKELSSGGRAYNGRDVLVRSLNKIFFIFQRVHMAKKRTTENVGLKKAQFHKGEREAYIMREYQKRKNYYQNAHRNHIAMSTIPIMTGRHKVGEVYN